MSELPPFVERATESGGEPERKDAFREIADIMQAMSSNVRHAIDAIAKINRMTKLLSINAQIEAARAGERGTQFGVVASEMNRLAAETQVVVQALEESTSEGVSSLNGVIEDLSVHLLGVRLSDLALTNIDLIDRNLYERSCDVRWWATDSSLVTALSEPSQCNRAFATERLAVILKAYTVYADLVLCDLDGRVVANGRPEIYASAGTNQARATWFRSALATGSGDEFGFQSVHRSELIKEEHALVYSCVVRRGGSCLGEPLGVLGIVFRWRPLAQVIVNETPLSTEERARTRVCITDGRGLVLADSAERSLDDTLEFSSRHRLYAQRKTFALTEIDSKKYLIAHAQSQGFETYKTGWHSVILQQLVEAPA